MINEIKGDTGEKIRTHNTTNSNMPESASIGALFDRNDSSIVLRDESVISLKSRSHCESDDNHTNASNTNNNNNNNNNTNNLNNKLDVVSMTTSIKVPLNMLYSNSREALAVFRLDLDEVSRYHDDENENGENASFIESETPGEVH